MFIVNNLLACSCTIYIYIYIYIYNMFIVNKFVYPVVTLVVTVYREVSRHTPIKKMAEHLLLKGYLISLIFIFHNDIDLYYAIIAADKQS